jgi:hypothetical protein
MIIHPEIWFCIFSIFSLMILIAIKSRGLKASFLNLVSLFIHNKRGMWQKDVVRMIVLAASLAVYKVFFEAAWQSWMESLGYGNNDFGTTLLGYLIVILIGYAVTVIFTRPMKKVEVHG